MNNPARGLAALLTLVAGLTFAVSVAAQDKAALQSDRDKISYMVGMDIAHSIAPAAADVDVGELRKALQNAMVGGPPLISVDEARATGQALMQRVAARSGQGTAAPPAVDPAKVADLIGADIGRSLTPIKDDIDLDTTMQALRTVIAGKPTLLDATQADAVRAAFSARVQSRTQQAMQAAAGKNDSAGSAFLANNTKQSGVFTTASGLQYRVLRQGAGGHPQPGDTVRVNYRGTLLDGSVFDSSYDRGQPEQFKLDQVIKGWAEGLQLMPVGGKYRFWIPGKLAYGAQGTPNGPIGPNATLVFDVELLGIQ